MIRLGVCTGCDESSFLFTDRGVQAFVEWHNDCQGLISVCDGMDAYRVVVRKMYREALEVIGA